MPLVHQPVAIEGIAGMRANLNKSIKKKNLLALGARIVYQPVAIEGVAGIAPHAACVCSVSVRNAERRVRVI